MTDRPEQRTTECAAALTREAANTPGLLGYVLRDLMRAAQAELDNVCQGRVYCTKRVELTITDNGPSFIRDMFDAEIQVTVELVE